MKNLSSASEVKQVIMMSIIQITDLWVVQKDRLYAERIPRVTLMLTRCLLLGSTI